MLLIIIIIINIIIKSDRKSAAEYKFGFCFNPKEKCIETIIVDFVDFFFVYIHDGKISKKLFKSGPANLATIANF